jgi:hypothetical protein
MGKWHNYQFLEKRVAGERMPCPSCGVVPCLSDVPRNPTRVSNFGESGTIKKGAVETSQVLTVRES